jgi:predicted protein tyrosine phosphatase
MRQFTWCRQEIAENCKWGGEHVHIVITTPGYRRIMPSCKKTTLRLFFHDLEPDKIRKTVLFAKDPAKGQETIDGCFSEQHAHDIVRFVGATDKDETIIVNCEAGVSRSPAVVMALWKAQGEEIESVYRKAHPNIHVANTLGRVLGVGPFEEPKYEGIVNPFAPEEQKP